MLTTAKGLPLTYNKDLQEDKEGFFDAIDTVKFTLAVYRDMILTMTVNVDKMAQAVSKDFSNATDWQTIWYARDCPSVRHMRLSANALPMLFIRANSCRRFLWRNTSSSPTSSRAICW